jgi:hypothetical protein
MAGSLGVSPSVCLLTNGDNGQIDPCEHVGPVLARRPTVVRERATLVRSTTPGPGLVVDVLAGDGCANQWRERRSMCGTPRPRASMKIKTPRKRR